MRRMVLLVCVILFICSFIPNKPISCLDSIEETKIDLQISSKLILTEETNQQFNRTFSLPQKFEINFIRVRCFATSDKINSVTVNATLNTKPTVQTFYDSFSNLTSTNSFGYPFGTSLHLMINNTTDILRISNQLTLTFNIAYSSLSFIDPGNFQIEEVIFHSVKPRFIPSELIGEMILPSSISEGIYFISSYSLFLSRTLRTEVFLHTKEAVRLQFRIETLPDTLPLSSADIEVHTADTVYRNESREAALSLCNSVVADIERNTRRITLVLKFRPSGNTLNSYIAFNFRVYASIAPGKPKQSESTIYFLGLPQVSPIIIEIIRWTCFFIPLNLFYSYRKRLKKSSPDIALDKSSLRELE